MKSPREALLKYYEGKRKKRTCLNCGKEYEHIKNSGTTLSFCCKECSIQRSKYRNEHRKLKDGLEEISSYYKEKGFSRIYVAKNPEGRRVATLRRTDGYMTSMSYAKYLYTSYYKCDIEAGDQVDHINGDKTDDRIENLQVISRYYNSVKDKPRRQMIQKTCPICGCDFLVRKGNEKAGDQCCSKECGYKHSSITLKSIKLRV